MLHRRTPMTERTDSVPDGADDVTDGVDRVNDGTDTGFDRDGVVRETYEQEQDRSLTDALLDAIVRCRGDDLQRTDFALFEDVDPDALEDLLREDAQPRTSVTLEAEDVRLEFRGDGGGVEIRAEDRSDE